MKESLFKVLVFLFFYSGSLFGVYDLSIVAIFRNEGEFFREWIEFHKLQGVQHFYLYNHLSEDNYLESLSPYVANGDVTLIDWNYDFNPGDHDEWLRIQCSAYMHCINNFGNESAWVAAIDIDEFLFCSCGEKLPELLRGYPSYGGVCVNWVKYGTSNIEEIPPGRCLVEMLTYTLKPTDKDNLWVKSIVQPKFVLDCKTPHMFTYKDKRFAVDEDRKEVADRKSLTPKIKRIRINHYWTRTVSFFLNYKIGDRQHRRPNFDTERLLKMAEECNKYYDPSILQFVPKLRAALGYDEQD